MDEVDKKVISQLQLNGRTTFEELGKLIGYTSMGAKKRFDKLIEEDKVKISAALNTASLKLCPAVVMLEMENSEAMMKLLERFKECPRVINIFTTLGGYNIIAIIVAEDQETLESISIEKCSLRSGGGIRRSEFYPVGNINYEPFLAVRAYLTRKGKETTPCNVDCRPCTRYLSKKCCGCPATRYYKGTL